MDANFYTDSAIAMPVSREDCGEYRKEFGLRIRKNRKSLGLSQEQLAHRSGLHRNYISDVERGRRNLSLDALLRLANGLSINIRELF
jgi:transcriptional regulator with XRE-family HTH domain